VAGRLKVSGQGFKLFDPASRYEFRILTNVSSELLNFVDDE
jgi:hypothetical protein